MRKDSILVLGVRNGYKSGKGIQKSLWMLNRNAYIRLMEVNKKNEIFNFETDLILSFSAIAVTH